MASEESKLNNQEASDDNPAAIEQPSSPTTSTTPAAKDPDPAIATDTDDDDDDPRAGGDMDFGQLLDQFEQEQASLQEGEVVRGTVVGISERGVVIDFGYKSEGIVNPAEFTENGVLAVKAGDEVAIKDKPKSRQLAVRNLELTQIVPVPDWLTVDRDGLKGKVAHIPSREEMQPIVNEQLIVELYSR